MAWLVNPHIHGLAAPTAPPLQRILRRIAQKNYASATLNHLLATLAGSGFCIADCHNFILLSISFITLSLADLRMRSGL